MKRRRLQQTPWIYTALLYACGFLMFLEWLYPVRELTETGQLAVFVIFALFCFSVSFIKVHFFISFLLKGAGLLLIMHGLFFQEPLLSTVWLTELYQQIGWNMASVVTGQYEAVTPLFRSVLFLTLIWLLSYLIHYWFAVTKRIFLFVLLTFIYITVLGTFTAYDAEFAVIRTFVIAFAALGIAHLLKKIDREQIRLPRSTRLFAWLLPLIGAVFLAAVIGYLTPVYEPKWPDPVPFLENTVKDMLREKSANLHKVGYGEDDSRLGGSFVQDYTTVFRTQAQKDHYWRIETKDEYTGKGWKSSVDSSYTMADDGTITLETFSGAVETEQLEATLDFQGNTEIEKLVYPYGAASVDTEENVQLLTDDHDGEIRTQINSRDVSLNHYTIHYQYPSFSINAMREAGDEDPGEIAETYTQLPPSLPSRVDELAEEITADETNRYDKARAVEKYFGRSGFVYQLSNVPVPEADQDYVDQFLFDTKKGYCDNYSTSMIVLLRTLDIPARWAKGFTSGERIDELNDGSNLYEITSANAHSWVEVYFPEIGWVPFEPTQGFSNLADFHLEEKEKEGQEEEEEATEEKEEEKETEEQHKPEQDVASGDEKEAEAGKQPRWKYTAIVLAGLVLLAAVLYLTRWHWLAAYYRRKWENHPDAETFAALYQFTLKMLRRKGLPKMPEETLREYAARVDRQLGTDEMGRLTAVYERILYHHDKTVGETAEITKLWKDLITHLKG